MKIIKYPNDLLLKKCDNVNIITKELKDLARNMYVFMINNNGVGLAAPQIGELIRLIVLNNEGIPLYMFNPKIMKFSKSKNVYDEGCLSFPNTYYEISRPDRIFCSYLDINGKIKSGNFNGLPARIIQHEVDHLNGVLFIEKV